MKCKWLNPFQSEDLKNIQGKTKLLWVIQEVRQNLHNHFIIKEEEMSFTITPNQVFTNLVIDFEN